MPTSAPDSPKPVTEESPSKNTYPQNNPVTNDHADVVKSCISQGKICALTIVVLLSFAGNRYRPSIRGRRPFDRHPHQSREQSRKLILCGTHGLFHPPGIGSDGTVANDVASMLHGLEVRPKCTHHPCTSFITTFLCAMLMLMFLPAVKRRLALERRLRKKIRTPRTVYINPDFEDYQVMFYSNKRKP